MGKQLFDDVGFFKSSELNSEGKLVKSGTADNKHEEELIKAIPTMPQSNYKEVAQIQAKKVPKDVKKYVDECEKTFKYLDEKVKEIITSEKLQSYYADHCIKMSAAYRTFKECFSRCANQIINSPKQSDVKKEKNSWDVSRINI